MTLRPPVAIYQGGPRGLNRLGPARPRFETLDPRVEEATMTNSGHLWAIG